MLMRPSNLIAGCHLSRGHRHRCGYRGPSADHTAKTHPARLRCSGLLENCDAKDMLGYKHSGFSVDAGVCIEAHDRAALERLLRYCAVHRFPWSACAKGKQTGVPLRPNSAASPPVTSVVPRQMSCTSPLELIDRIAALVPPPPRTHRHRYFGVLAQTRR